MLLKLFEQATYIRTELDSLKLTNSIMSEFIKDLVELLTESKEKF